MKLPVLLLALATLAACSSNELRACKGDTFALNPARTAPLAAGGGVAR